MMSTLSNPMNISPFFRCFSLFSTCLLDFYPPFFGYPFTGSFPNIIFSRKKGCHLWGSLPGHLLCSHFSSTLNDSSASLSLKNMLLTARFISQIAEIQVWAQASGSQVCRKRTDEEALWKMSQPSFICRYFKPNQILEKLAKI